MPHEHTRQRQGRDFALRDNLIKALEETRRNSENAQIGEETKKSLLRQLEQYKTEAERNSTPIDGHEPPEIRRNLI